MINPPQTIQDVIENSGRMVRQSSSHALTPQERKKLYAEITSFPKGNEVIRWLAVVSAEFVLPVLEQNPSMLNLREILNLAQSVLTGGSPIDMLIRQADEIWDIISDDSLEDIDPEEAEHLTVDFEDLVEEGDNGFPYLGEQLMYYMLLEVSGVEPLEYIGKDTTNFDLFTDSPDTVMLAETIYAGPTWVEKSSSARRLTFWNWWLAEAIPKAWAMAAAEKPG